MYSELVLENCSKLSVISCFIFPSLRLWRCLHNICICGFDISLLMNTCVYQIYSVDELMILSTCMTFYNKTYLKSKSLRLIGGLLICMTTPFLMRDCTFRPALDTRSYWAIRVLGPVSSKCVRLSLLYDRRKYWLNF